MKIFVCAILALTVACGGKNNGGDDGGGDDGGPGDDGGGTVADAFVVGCTTPDPSRPQCSNCIDDDGDGRTDSSDIQCTGPRDNDEGSFATGISGDNIDAVNQDCFFDGNSGAGNDGCNIHVCCLLGATTKSACPIGQNQYNPAECPPPIGTGQLSQKCIDTCGKLAPPGCDCFGCCTLCDPASNMCYDVIINPVTSPDCTQSTIGDSTKCKTCTKVPSCGNSTCGGSTCILCPGQDPNDLPASCNGSTACPLGTSACTNGTCPTGTYCDMDSQCCVGVIL